MFEHNAQLQARLNEMKVESLQQEAQSLRNAKRQRNEQPRASLLQSLLNLRPASRLQTRSA